ncbi:hypothetical protein EYS14_11405 [Alteromonadaceae bacterium M269]|nr:hypothetical protein EYS14_11405 [Alteromonadaceae bacterium M269]
MSEIHLPESISPLIGRLQLVELSWFGIPIQIPKFAVYAVIPNPVFDDIIVRKGRSIGLLKMGRYTVPVLDPFQGDVKKEPKFAVIVSLIRHEHFGLFAYPADCVKYDVDIPAKHSSVNSLVSDFL